MQTVILQWVAGLGTAAAAGVVTLIAMELHRPSRASNYLWASSACVAGLLPGYLFAILVGQLLALF